MNEVKNFRINKKKEIFVDGYGAKRIVILLNGLNLPLRFRKINKFDHSLLRFWLDKFTDINSLEQNFAKMMKKNL